ncbi:pentatricopeptide repeat-containing protein At1g59720, chloroplastic/mitochondrial-like isoform X2 [Arachis ipaensis]|uniref:pentatricopeptide repeat-containing protein At1g59720, chloroplastic/mitochondrial-like isoform X2 n=1 Tax=Arachis ipaensis TaxID=130454 RepID=UPI0007AF4A9B|nr:pentatricopeptide repeat-containing protein At1g59720, chloroplastic/mitochondrial-like isoform X2 [Arachis ipaensis]XP_025673572.1 pentatricopeptide repeat-containing protein At1g59720, chloroplastic/mitochondrial isoform X2 [Arachis hypogaea]
MITLELNFFHNSYRRATCEALILRFVVVGNALCSCLSNLIASYSRVCQIIYPIAIINLHSCPHRKPQSHFVFLLPTHRNINNNSQTQPEQRNFFMPSIYNIISQCLSSSTITLSHARQSHVHILKLGLYGDTYIATKLLSHDANNLYFLQVTNLVLHFFPNPTLPSFTTIINAFARSHQYDAALYLFSLMGHKGLAPDGFLLLTTIKACAALQALIPGLQFHGFEVTRKIRILENGVNEKIACGELSAEMFGDIFYWHIPILAMTADVTQASNEECKKCGMAQYLANLISVEGSFSAYSKKLARTIRWTVVELEIQYISF